MVSNSSVILGAYGEKIYASQREHPGKFRHRGGVHRDIKIAISPRDWAEMVEISSKLCARIPALRGAIRQKSEWAFAGDSWQPIFYGGNSKDWEIWGDFATDWLVHQVFPNAVRGNVRKDLIKAMQVSGMQWDIGGDDLALFVLGKNNMPQVQIVPGSRIGNGPMSADNVGIGWSQTISGGVYNVGGFNLYGMGTCIGGRYAGYRIYNGIIFDESDEPIAARVLGIRRNGEQWENTFEDFDIGFSAGAHMASEYEYHEMGRPLPRIAASVLNWMHKEQLDENFLKGVDLASRQTVIHKLAEGMDAAESRGDAMQQIEVTDANGNQQIIHVENTEAGDVKYISSSENLEGLKFENPHPNVEGFAKRILSECLSDLGWPYELTDLSSTGRAPTRLSCELVNNSLWQKQCTGETRLLWFVKFAIAQGIKFGHIPKPPASGSFDEPYKFTFGYPKEMSVDAGNDVTASLNKLRYGLTSQRVEAARWGYVLKRIQSDRKKENFTIMDDADDLVQYAKKKGHEIPFLKAVEFFWQPSPNSAAMPATDVAPADTKTETPKVDTVEPETKVAE